LQRMQPMPLPSPVGAKCEAASDTALGRPASRSNSTAHQAWSISNGLELTKVCADERRAVLAESDKARWAGR
jgi:hypothetical protein